MEIDAALEAGRAGEPFACGHHDAPPASLVARFDRRVYGVRAILILPGPRPVGGDDEIAVREGRGLDARENGLEGDFLFRRRVGARKTSARHGDGGEQGEGGIFHDQLGLNHAAGDAQVWQRRIARRLHSRSPAECSDSKAGLLNNPG